MEPGDMPKPAEPSRLAQTRDEFGEPSREEIDRLKRQLNISPPLQTTANPEMKNHGQISEMSLPGAWVETGPYSFAGGIGTRSFRGIHPPEHPKAILGFYYRGLPVSEEAGDHFHTILAEPPHVLGAAELESLSEVLRDKAWIVDFAKSSARTENINGKQILVVEGRYLGIQEDSCHFFVDALGDGRVVQEIYYQAPKDIYARYLKEAQDSLKSIKWKS